MSSLRIIGITGGICSGKSTCIEHISRHHGFKIVNADRLGHVAYKQGTECYRKVVAAFGQGVIAADGEIDRKALGPIVFGSAAEMKKLNGIVWPAIEGLIREHIEEAKRKHESVIVFEAAVLLEARWDKLMTEVWVLEIPPEVALKRICSRDGISGDDAKKRISAQMTNGERRRFATTVIDTNVSKDEMLRKIDDAVGTKQQ